MNASASFIWPVRRARRHTPLDPQYLQSEVDRPELTTLQAEINLERLRADPTAHQLRPSLTGGRLVRTPVIDLRYVARRAVEENDDGVLPVEALECLFEIADVTGRDTAGTGGGVAGEVHDAAQAVPLGIPGCQDADFRVAGARWFEDVRIALAWMSDGPAVPHLEAAVECHARLAALVNAGAPRPVDHSPGKPPQ